MGNNRRKDSKPAPVAGKTSKKPLAPQLKANKTSSALGKTNKRQTVEVISRPWLLPQFDELPKEDRDIVVDRIRKEVVDATVTHPAIKPFIVRGVNHVTRLIAKRELRVVVFANNPDVSAGAFGHIPVLCRLHKVPICVVHLSSKAFGSVFQQPNLVVFGIKRLPKAINAAADTKGSADPDSPEADASVTLSELDYEKLTSISEFLVGKSSKKNHSLQ